VSGETYITLAGQVLTANQITSANITNGTILYADINQNGATSNQSFRWNGSAWVNYTTVTSLTTSTTLTNVSLDFNSGAASGPIILGANASRAGVLTAALWSKLDTLNNQRVLAGSGIGVVKVGQDYTVTNNAPDQTVTITGATGTYPNFILPTIDGSETKVNSGTSVSVTGAGTIASPYVINNSAPESTTVTDGITIDLTKTGSNITAELQQQAATAGQTLKWDGTKWAPANDNVGLVTTNNLVGTARTTVTNGTGSVIGALPVTVDVNETGLNPVNIPITDTGNFFTTDNINAALQQLGTNNHVPLTVTDGTIIDFTLTGQNLTATILSGSITTTEIANGTIATADLANGSVTNAKIGQSGATDGQVLRWNNTVGSWEPSNTASGTLTGITGGAGITISGAVPVLTVTATDPSLSNEGLLSVAAGTATTAQILSNTTGSNAINLSAGTGMSITENVGSSTITFTNNQPDQTVALTGAGITNVSGTYPNFTITSTEAQTASTVNATVAAPFVGSTVQAQLTELGVKTTSHFQVKQLLLMQ
jgi:hypothetical protein